VLLLLYVPRITAELKRLHEIEVGFSLSVPVLN